MLDEEHEPLEKPRNDHDAYTLGSIYGHNIVIACLPNVRPASQRSRLKKSLKARTESP